MSTTKNKCFSDITKPLLNLTDEIMRENEQDIDRNIKERVDALVIKIKTKNRNKE